jgi:hypothetical protein
MDSQVSDLQMNQFIDTNKKDFNYINRPVKIPKVEAVIKLIEKDEYLMSMFTIVGHSQGCIHLNRNKEAACVISGKIHRHCSSFITYSDGSIKLFCLNPNCQNKFGMKYKEFYLIVR